MKNKYNISSLIVGFTMAASSSLAFAGVPRPIDGHLELPTSVIVTRLPVLVREFDIHGSDGLGVKIRSCNIGIHEPDSFRLSAGDAAQHQSKNLSGRSGSVYLWLDSCVELLRHESAAIIWCFECRLGLCRPTGRLLEPSLSQPNIH